jgi:hypothetical protein
MWILGGMRISHGGAAQDGGRLLGGVADCASRRNHEEPTAATAVAEPEMPEKRSR